MTTLRRGERVPFSCGYSVALSPSTNGLYPLAIARFKRELWGEAMVRVLTKTVDKIGDERTPLVTGEGKAVAPTTRLH